MTSDLTSALAEFFSATWPTDAPIPEPGALPHTRWSDFTDLGLHLVGVPEEAGGSGGTLEDLVALALLAGRHAVDVPLVESTTATWALAEAGLPVDATASHSMPVGASLLRAHEDGTFSGTLRDVPWGTSVDRVVAFADDGRTVLISPESTVARPGTDLAGQFRDALELARVAPLSAASGADPEKVRGRAAALRIGLVAGSLMAVSELTRRYVSERVQFGKPVAAFQAVQAHVVQIEQMAVMTTALAERLALHASIRGDLPEFDVAAACLVAGENALVAARAAHQAHGAIGMTREYRLQGFTRRLHTWTGDLGEAIELSRLLGATAAHSSSFAQLVLDDQRPELLP